MDGDLTREGSPTWRKEHRADRKEAEERMRKIREQLEGAASETLARREAGGEPGLEQNRHAFARGVDQRPEDQCPVG